MNEHLQIVADQIVLADGEINQLVQQLATRDDIIELRDTTISAQWEEIQRLNAIIADLTKPPAPVVPKVVGQSLESVPPNVTKVDGIPAYFQPGDFAAGKAQILWSTVNDNTMRVVREGEALGAKTFWFSFKDGATPAEAAKIDAFLDSCPKDKGYTYLVTYFHEHNGNIRDGDLTLEEYWEGSKLVADIAHKHGMLFGPNHNGANLKVVNGKNTWVYDPALWAMHEADISLYDFWSCDGYAKNYTDPAVLFKPAADYAKSLGLPLCWRETASPAGTLQAGWAAKARTWMEENCHVFFWWSSQKSSTEPNYRLSEASAKAWYKL